MRSEPGWTTHVRQLNELVEEALLAVVGPGLVDVESGRVELIGAEHAALGALRTVTHGANCTGGGQVALLISGAQERECIVRPRAGFSHQILPRSGVQLRGAD